MIRLGARFPLKVNMKSYQLIICSKDSFEFLNVLEQLIPRIFVVRVIVIIILTQNDAKRRNWRLEADSLAKLEEQTGKAIRLQPEALYTQDQFDVVLM